MTTRTLIDHGTFYEGPRWHDGRWWVSDFYRQLVLSFDPDGGDVREELVVEQLPSGSAGRPTATCWWSRRWTTPSCAERPTAP